MPGPQGDEDLRALLEYAQDIVTVIEADGTIAYVSPAVETVLGYDPQALVGEVAFDLIHPDDRPAVEERFMEVVDDPDRITERLTYRQRHRDGGWVWVESIGSNQTDTALGGYVINTRDISDRKRRIEQLQYYERAIEGSHDLIAAIDETYTYLFANERYCEVHGIDPETVPGARLDDVIDEATLATVRPLVDRALGGETIHYRMERPAPASDELHLDIRYYPLEDPGSGDVHGAVATMRDVTALEENNQQLLVMDRVLRHNLRNTMNLVRGLAETIRDRAGDETAERAARIVTESDALMTTVEKERDITRLLVDRPRPEPTDLGRVLDAVLDRVRRAHPAATISVEDRSPAPTAVAIADIDRGLEELLDNALSHGDDASPTVSVVIKQTEDDVTIRIADRNDPIPEMERAVLLGHGENDPLYHGNGLGLWLVYWIVRRSGGTVTYERLEPRGNAITITLSSP